MLQHRQRQWQEDAFRYNVLLTLDNNIWRSTCQVHVFRILEKGDVALSNKKEYPSWYKMFVDNEYLDIVDDRSVGRGERLIRNYIRTGELPQDEDTTVMAVFYILKPAADKAIETYQARSEAGKAGADAKWGNR